MKILNNQEIMCLISKPYLWRLMQSSKKRFEYDGVFHASKTYNHVFLNTSFTVRGNYAELDKKHTIGRFLYIYSTLKKGFSVSGYQLVKKQWL